MRTIANRKARRRTMIAYGIAILCSAAVLVLAIVVAVTGSSDHNLRVLRLWLQAIAIVFLMLGFFLKMAEQRATP